MTDARFSRWGGRLAAYLARADAITTTARLLFAVYDSPQFPRSLWIQFRATSTARGIPWLDALREAVERYVNTEYHDECCAESRATRAHATSAKRRAERMEMQITGRRAPRGPPRPYSRRAT